MNEVEIGPVISEAESNEFFHPTISKREIRKSDELSYSLSFML